MKNVIDEIGPGITSLEFVRGRLNMARPASLTAMLVKYAEPIVIDEPLVTDDGVALGGHHTITLERTGRSRHVGRMRATGFPSFRFGLRTVVGALGSPFVALAAGEVHGTNEIGDRESSWDDIDDANGFLRYWALLKGATHTTTLDFEADLLGDIGDVVTFVATIAGGAAVAGSVGACFVLGIHAADAAGLDEALGTAGLAGVLVASGVLLVFGPGAVIAAIVAGAAAGVAVELALKHRRLTERPLEVEFANRVFEGTLPVERIVLTNMLGIGRRPFAMPSVGDTILVNLGAGFEDPAHYTGLGDPDGPLDQFPGQLFIHELVHAWQFDVTHFLPGLMCGALLDQSTTLGGSNSVYAYGAPGRDFRRFNLEQQAKIVDDWFAGTGPPDQPRTRAGSADSPYFRYVRDNIRKRIL